MKPESPVSKEYGRAAEFLDTMGQLRRVWAGFQPVSPLNRSDMMALGAVDELTRRDRPVTVSRLAKATHQSLPGASQRARALERMGYLRRTDDPKDRRVSYVELTEEGRAVAEDALRNFFEQIEAALDDFGPENTDALLRLVRQLNDTIDRAPPRQTK